MEDSAAQAAGSGAATAVAKLVPWNQIPKFVPGETDIRVYTRKLEFLRALWPKEHLEHLGPRAALQVEGVAFQKVSRLDPEKLRSPDGVAYLVSSTGRTSSNFSNGLSIRFNRSQMRLTTHTWQDTMLLLKTCLEGKWNLKKSVHTLFFAKVF